MSATAMSVTRLWRKTVIKVLQPHVGAIGGPDRADEFPRQFASHARHIRQIWPDYRHCGRIPDTVGDFELELEQGGRLAGGGAVGGAAAHDTELRQIRGAGPGSAATRLSRNRFLCRIERAGL